jgi:hypothetical protein
VAPPADGTVESSIKAVLKILGQLPQNPQGSESIWPWIGERGSLIDLSTGWLRFGIDARRPIYWTLILKNKHVPFLKTEKQVKICIFCLLYTLAKIGLSHGPPLSMTSGVFLFELRGSELPRRAGWTVERPGANQVK